jgi:hydrocephalus-inducing protein
VLHTRAEGFLAPGQDVKLEVTFHPTAVNPDIRVEQLRCRLTGSAGALAALPEPPPAASSGGSAGRQAPAPQALQTIPDLLLTLTGTCSASEPVGEPVVFRCKVRASTSKALRLDNTSSANWQLRPIISHEFWSGPEFVQVPAGGSAEYALVYKPLAMTPPGEGQPHKGSVFFPLPDGSGLLYVLHGQVRPQATHVCCRSSGRLSMDATAHAASRPACLRSLPPCRRSSPRLRPSSSSACPPRRSTRRRCV